MSLRGKAKTVGPPILTLRFRDIRLSQFALVVRLGDIHLNLRLRDMRLCLQIQSKKVILVISQRTIEPNTNGSLIVKQHETKR